MTEVEALRNQVHQLEAQLAVERAKQQALLIQHEMWVEQGRQLQNQLQTWQRMYGGLFDMLGKGVVTDADIRDNLALAAQELRQPVVGVEAVRAAMAMIKDDTQGAYTAVQGKRGSKPNPARVKGGLA